MTKVFLALVFLIVSTTSVFAQDISGSPQSFTPSPTPMGATRINYELPYPGLLPDNPLYFLKVFRDRIVSTLITDPLRKVEFDLLQADKRIHAGVMLVKNGKDDLGVSTISKGINYFDQAVGNIQVAQKQGSDIKPLLENLYASSRKYKEVFTMLTKQVDKKSSNQLMLEMKRLEKYEKTILELKKKQK